MHALALQRDCFCACNTTATGMTVDQGGCHNLVCEFAPLGSLDGALDRIPGSRLPWPMVSAVGAQVVGGMAAIVAQRVLHRDLSLRNVLCFRLDVTTNNVLVKVGKC